MRYLSILTFLFSIAVINPAAAGVVVDSNGIVTEFTETSYSQNTYYFYEGSYDSTNSTSATTKSLEAMAQFFFYTDLEASLRSYSGTVTLNPTVSYVMTSAELANTVYVHEVLYDAVNQEWQSYSSREYSKSATDNAPNGMQTFYFASLTAPTGGSTGSVPEPSTALAIGLLGVLGFAGNRRRRPGVANA